MEPEKIELMQIHDPEMKSTEGVLIFEDFTRIGIEKNFRLARVLVTDAPGRTS